MPLSNFKSFCAVLCVYLTLGLAGIAFGQGERTSLTGTVTDDSQAMVVDATVTVRDTATNVTTRTTTNSAGLYFITSLPPGDYNLTVKKPASRNRRSTHSAHADPCRHDQRYAARRKCLTNGRGNCQRRPTGVAEFGTAIDDHHKVSRGVANISASPLAYSALAPNVVPTTGQQGLGNAVIGSATNSQMGGGLASRMAIWWMARKAAAPMRTARRTRFHLRPCPKFALTPPPIPPNSAVPSAVSRKWLRNPAQISFTERAGNLSAMPT